MVLIVKGDFSPKCLQEQEMQKPFCEEATSIFRILKTDLGWVEHLDCEELEWMLQLKGESYLGLSRSFHAIYFKPV